MSTTTTNLNLVKQAGSENPSLTALNSNWDTIDSAVANCTKTVPYIVVGTDVTSTSSFADKVGDAILAQGFSRGDTFSFAGSWSNHFGFSGSGSMYADNSPNYTIFAGDELYYAASSSGTLTMLNRAQLHEPTLVQLSGIQNSYYEIDGAYAITLGSLVIVSFAVKATSTASDWVNILNLPGAAAASFSLGKYDSSGDVEFDVRTNGDKLRAAGGLADSHWRNAVFAYISQ